MSATIFDATATALQSPARDLNALDEEAEAWPLPSGTVVYYNNQPDRLLDEHVQATLDDLAERLARVLRYVYGGVYDPRRRPAGHVYFVPRATLTSNEAKALGIRDRDDLFGGVVPHQVLRSKLNTHGLINDSADSPVDWTDTFPERVAGLVLPGYTAFSKADVSSAARSLLRRGAIRVKPGDDIGETVVQNDDELEAFLATMTEAAVARCGMVVETNLTRAVTFSIGQVYLGGLSISYCGMQRVTVNHQGEEVYGGSDLRAVPGDFDALLRLGMSADAKLAIRQARCFHEAVSDTYPDLTVSRCNYDIAQGCDGSGRGWSGVLDQSWSVGGASPAEIAAIEAFEADPELRAVKASAVEYYGVCEPPPHARIHYSGVDPRVGQLVKFSVVESDEHSSRNLHHPS